MASSLSSSNSLYLRSLVFSDAGGKNGRDVISLRFTNPASGNASNSSRRQLHCRSTRLHIDNEFRLLPSRNEDGGVHGGVSVDLVEAATLEQRRRSEAGEEGKSSRRGVMYVQPRPTKGLASALLDLLEWIVVSLVHDSSKPNEHLNGNYAPVTETAPLSNLTVRGSLPECLNGEFVRVCPNPKFPPVAGYHWFDGDGMIHGLRIKNGNPTYVSRYVRTSRLMQEEYFGAAKFIKVGDLKGQFGLFMYQMQLLREKLKVLDFSYGTGTGSIALTYHNGQLLALREDDKPYVIEVLEDGDLQTVGILDYDKKLTHTFSAHPKIDPFTNEMFTFGCSYTPPYVTYYVISKDGAILYQVPIKIQEPIMMHDFAITKNYAIFMDLPLCIRPKELMKGKSAFSFDSTKKARFGILPRYAKDELQIEWFELPSCFIFHNANAWEEGDEIVLITCRLEIQDAYLSSGVQIDQMENLTNQLYEMRFNMKTGAATQKQLSAPCVDFPKINDSYVGRRQRYVYGSVVDIPGKIKGIVKFDLHAKPQLGKQQIEIGGNVQGIFEFGPGRFGSEAVFVPRRPGINFEEDDGYLIFFVHDEYTGKSEANVIDAKTMSPDPVAVVDLPIRVPYGFHSLFVNEEQLGQHGGA